MSRSVTTTACPIDSNRSSVAASATRATMAPWIVPAGLHTSGRTSISTTPALGIDRHDLGLLTQRPGDPVVGREREPRRPPGDTIGFGGSSGLRGTWANPMAPAATSPPCSSTTSSEPWADRRPCRRIVPEGGDLRRRRDRAHPQREVGGEGPRVGIGVEGDPRDHVDGEGDHAGPEDAVVQLLLAGLDLDDEAALVDERRGAEPPGTEWRLAGRSVIERRR